MSASKAPTACRPSRGRRFLLLASWLAASGVLAQQAHDAHELDAAAGKALFERTWVTAPASTASADGLGPYYDARSCAACHPAGGAGAVPEFLTIVLDDPVYGRQLQRRAVVGLPAEAVVSFSVDEAEAEAELADLSLQPGTVQPSTPQRIPLQLIRATFTALQYGPVTSAFSLRRPPPLAGVARFEEVSAAALQALADPLDANGDGISGRVAGRYGWKAEVQTIQQQIARAFSVDLGISSPWFPSNSGDCMPSQHACLEHGANSSTGAEVEVEPLVLDLVTSYLHMLPLPGPAHSDAEGRALFEGFGCAACHVAELSTPTRPLQAWTDLLLHDMGPGLAVGTNDPAHDAMHDDDSALHAHANGPATAREWRTAPLWGLGKREAYLHDGRARTLEEAILWHGGEAEQSKRNFANAGEAQRQRVQAFLLGL